MANVPDWATSYALCAGGLAALTTVVGKAWKHTRRGSKLVDTILALPAQVDELRADLQEHLAWCEAMDRSDHGTPGDHRGGHGLEARWRHAAAPADDPGDTTALWHPEADDPRRHPGRAGAPQPPAGGLREGRQSAAVDLRQPAGWPPSRRAAG